MCTCCVSVRSPAWVLSCLSAESRPVLDCILLSRTLSLFESQTLCVRGRGTLMGGESDEGGVQVRREREDHQEEREDAFFLQRLSTPCGLSLAPLLPPPATEEGGSEGAAADPSFRYSLTQSGSQAEVSARACVRLGTAVSMEEARAPLSLSFLNQFCIFTFPFFLHEFHDDSLQSCLRLGDDSEWRSDSSRSDHLFLLNSDPWVSR